MMKLQSTGILYQNPKPYLRAIHALHPTVSWLADGSLFAAFDLGQGPESLDYGTWSTRSMDGGRTWSTPAPLTLPIMAGRYANQIVRVGKLRDGTMLAMGARIYRDQLDEGFVSRTTFGYAPLDLFTMRSGDGGQTWTEPRTIEPPLVGPTFELCHPPVELADGRIIAPMSTWKAWDGAAPNGMKAIALVSYDGGCTWPDYLDVMDRWAEGYIHFEQSCVQMPDGRLLAVAWALHEPSGVSAPVPYAISRDGLTFDVAGSTNITGQTTKIVSLNDNYVVWLSRRTDVPGMWAGVAEVDGSGWRNLHEIPVWQGAGVKLTAGAAAGDELAQLKCGSPSLVRLDSENIFAAFWCNEDGISVVRWIHVCVNPALLNERAVRSAGSRSKSPNPQLQRA